MKLTDTSLRSLISETNALTAEFGDQKLAKMNAKFDRQFTIAERRAEPAVTIIVEAVVVLAVAGAFFLMGGSNG